MGMIAFPDVAPDRPRQRTRRLMAGDPDTEVGNAERPTAQTDPTGRAVSDDMLVEEAERARSFGGIIAFLCVLVLAFVPFLGGETWLQAAMALVLVTFGLASIGVRLSVRDPSNYTPTLFRVYGAIAVTTALVIQYYLGVFTPTPLAVVLGIAFFAQGQDRVGAWAISVSATAVTVLLAAAVASGLIPDLGIIDTSHASGIAKLFFVLVVPMVFIVTLLQGRANREASLALHERVRRSVLAAAGGEARLVEVREELEVLRAPIGRGAHTGTMAGAFKLGDILGRGAVGEVYVGNDGSRRAAVKVLRASWAGEADVLARFERECALMAALDSPHTVRLHGHGTLESGPPFLAMELLEGRDLAEVLRDGPRLPTAQVSALVAQVASGLEVAHRAGIVHRDLKPRNLFEADGVWKILDFGIARVLGPGSTLTAHGVVGTPNYMSPEQARSESVDIRSDVFSLGSVIYRCLLGQAPFSGRTPLMTIYRVAERRPLRPREIREDLSRQHEAFLTIALAMDRGDRFGSASELAEAFAQATAGTLPARWMDHARFLVKKHPWEKA